VPSLPLVLATKSVKRNGTALALAGRAAILLLTTSIRKNCFVYFADILQINSMTCHSLTQKMQMNKSSISVLVTFYGFCSLSLNINGGKFKFEMSRKHRPVDISAHVQSRKIGL
jgi:hypothetical protein